MPELDRFTEDDARRIGAAVGIDWAAVTFDVEQYRLGLHVELEHGVRRVADKNEQILATVEAGKPTDLGKIDYDELPGG